MLFRNLRWAMRGDEAKPLRSSTGEGRCIYVSSTKNIKEDRKILGSMLCTCSPNSESMAELYMAVAVSFKSGAKYLVTYRKELNLKTGVPKKLICKHS